jgi:hypothetical protein
MPTVHRTFLLTGAILLLASCGSLGATPREPSPFPLAEDGTPTPSGMSSLTATSTEPPVGGPDAASIPSTSEPAAIEIIIMDLEMVSADAGWAIGRQASSIGSDLSAFRTGDGGSHWQDVWPVQARRVSDRSTLPYSLFALDGLNAWLAITTPLPGAGNGAQPSDVTVYRTADGGLSWTAGSPFQIPQGRAGPAVFIDLQHGWLIVGQGVAAGSSGLEIHRTSDGGLTWQLMSRTSPYPADHPTLGETPGSLPFSCSKTGISFADDHAGWATGECSGPGLFLYFSNDQGRTWLPRRTFPVPNGLSEDAFSLAQSSIQPPVFFAGGRGIMYIRLYLDPVVHSLYTTADGGITWIPHDLPVPPNCMLDFVSPLDGWLSDCESLFRTADGGTRWSYVADITRAGNPSFLQFVDASHGWYTVGDGPMYRTQDGGATWQSLIPVLSAASPPVLP